MLVGTKRKTGSTRRKRSREAARARVRYVMCNASIAFANGFPRGDRLDGSSMEFQNVYRHDNDDEDEDVSRTSKNRIVLPCRLVSLSLRSIARD